MFHVKHFCCVFLTDKFRKIELLFFNNSSISITILLFCDFVIRQV